MGRGSPTVWMGHGNSYLIDNTGLTEDYLFSSPRRMRSSSVFWSAETLGNLRLRSFRASMTAPGSSGCEWIQQRDSGVRNVGHIPRHQRKVMHHRRCRQQSVHGR